MMEAKLKQLLAEMNVSQDYIDDLDLQWLIVQLPLRYRAHKVYQDAYLLVKELYFIQKRSEEK